MHSNYNPDLLEMIPTNLKRVVEVGCSSGALAQAYAGINPDCIYTGIEIDPDFAEVAKATCHEVICGDIEHFTDELFLQLFPSDCWIFGDTLEHLYDPWALLQRIKPHLAPTAEIIACIPNAQHWSIQVKLNCGLFRYEDQGLLDRTHIRWFTRTTILEMFEASGYKIVGLFARIYDEPGREIFLPCINAMALAAGMDPQQATDDALPVQWIIKAIPI